MQTKERGPNAAGRARQQGEMDMVDGSSDNYREAFMEIAHTLEQHANAMANIHDSLDQLTARLDSIEQRSESSTADDEQAFWERLENAAPGERLDFSDLDPAQVDRMLKQLNFPKPRNAPEFDLGPHVQVDVNMWWGPFGEVRIFFDPIAVANYDRAVTFTNLIAVGVPIPAAGIVAGVMRIMVAVASENGLIVWVQLPSLVHTPLPA